MTDYFSLNGICVIFLIGNCKGHYERHDALCRIYPSKKKDMQRHEKFDHGDDLSTRLTTLVEKLEMLMTTISRNQGLNMGPNS